MHEEYIKLFICRHRNIDVGFSSLFIIINSFLIGFLTIIDISKLNDLFFFFRFSDQMVYSKREIPLEMKFGPIVGDTKTLNKHEIKMYGKSNSNFPLLFLSHNSILDVSNESKSRIIFL